MQNVILDGESAYVESNDKGESYLVLIIPIPDKGSGWVPNGSKSIERVTAIHAANGELGFRDMLTAGTQVPIKGLDDPTAKVVVKLTVDPYVARDILGQEIVLNENAGTSTPRRERRGIPVDDLTAKAVDNSRKAGPVTTRKMTPKERIAAKK